MMMFYPNFLRNLEDSFDFNNVIATHNAHMELPIFAVCVYICFIFYAPNLIKEAFRLHSIMAIWNLSLSVFSIIGASRLVPVLLTHIGHGGFVRSMCEHSASELQGGAGFWMALFIYSKFFELLDTVFLVLHRRPVIFLHWFHHVTVLLYCWVSYAQATSTGLWFAAMNYCVHSIMYFYYFLMIFRSLRPVVRVVAPLITSIQISQMIGGIVVSSVAAYKHLGEGPSSCAVPAANWKLGLAMYVSYFFLFASLFVEKFLRSTPGKAESKGVCNATDSAGMFRSPSAASLRGFRGAGEKKKRK